MQVGARFVVDVLEKYQPPSHTVEIGSVEQQCVGNPGYLARLNGRMRETGMVFLGHAL